MHWQQADDSRCLCTKHLGLVFVSCWHPPDTLKDRYIISVCHFVSVPLFFYFVGVSLFITMPNHTIVEYLKVYILCGLLKRHFNSENDVRNKICGVLCKCILLESVSLSLDSGINSSSRQSIISKPWIFEFRGLKWN